MSITKIGKSLVTIETIIFQYYKEFNLCKRKKALHLLKFHSFCELLQNYLHN